MLAAEKVTIKCNLCEGEVDLAAMGLEGKERDKRGKDGEKNYFSPSFSPPVATKAEEGTAPTWEKGN